jgi:hypothetical protein
MTHLKSTEIEVLQQRIAIFEVKIAEERLALLKDGSGSGNPAECSTEAGESRRDRLKRWEATLVAIRRVLAQYDLSRVAVVSQVS